MNIRHLPISNRQKLPVSIFKGCRGDSKRTELIDLEQFFERLLDDKNEVEVKKSEALKQLKKSDSKAYTDLKEKDCFAFITGNFTERKDKACKVYAPLLCFDIDGSDSDLITFTLEDCKKLPYVFSAFPSVSGQGLRILVWAQSTLETHKAYYQAILERLAKDLNIPTDKELRSRWSKEGKDNQAINQDLKTTEHLDTSTNNIGRIWFFTYVAKNDFYLNWESEVFVLEGIKKQTTANVSRSISANITSITEAEKVELCITKVKNQNLPAGRNNEVFALACELCRFGVSQSTALAHCSTYAEPDFEESEIKKSVYSAYQQKSREFTDEQILNYRAKLLNANGQTKSAKSKVEIIPAKELEFQELPPPDSYVLRIEENRYWCQKGKNEVPVSNFIITPLYLLKDTREPKRVMECTNINGEKTVVCCPVKALTSNREFAAIVEGKGNFVPSWSNNQFSIIKEYLYQYEKTAEEIPVLGHQPTTNYYAFADGIFDGKNYYQGNDYGIVTIKDQHYYLPAFSVVNEDAEKEFHNERKFIFQQGSTSFGAWARQIIKVFGDNAKVGICFVVAAVFRDLIFAHANSFPLLFLFGPKGTGKTTFRQSFTRLFGNYGPNDAIGLGSASSPKGFARKLAQVRNGLQAFEEYKNRINPSLIEMLKNVYDGIGYERAQTSNDNKTHATLVNSAVILGGQEMPTKENALFSRVVMLTFGKTKFSDEEKKAFGALERMIAPGLGNVLLEILQHREMMVNSFSFHFAKVYNHLRQDKTTNSMEERTLNNVAALIAPFLILKDVLDFPFDYKEIYHVFRSRIELQHKQMTKTNEVNQFWQVFEQLIDSGKVRKGQHYDVKEDLLYVDFSNIFPVYYEQAVKQNVNAMDQTTLESYLMMQPYYQPDKNGEKQRIRLENLRGVTVRKRCLAFDTKKFYFNFFSENLSQGA